MPFVDKTTGEINNSAFALDTHAATADEPSLFESAGNLVTKGIPLVGLATVNAFANTAIDIGNFFGLDNKKITIEDEVGQGDLNDYYKKHEEGIEAAALLVGSLAPGLGAIKGASMAVKAAYLAKGGANTEALAAATGILSPLKAKIVQGALTEIEAGDAALFGSMRLEKTKAIALGVADQALQGMVFSAATAATMHASPLLDKQTFGETMQDVFYGAVAGGLVGGVLEGIGTRALFNRALLKADNATKAQETSTRLGLGGYTAGDKVATLLDSLEQIPAATNPLGATKLSKTIDSAILDGKKTLQTITPKGDEEIANGVFDTVFRMRNEAGVTNKEDLYQYLGRLAKISRYTGDDSATVATGDTFFVNKFAKGESKNWTDIVTAEVHPDAEVSARYSLAPGATTVNIARFADEFTAADGSALKLFSTQKEAWEAGQDIYINSKLEVKVNPDSVNLTKELALEGHSRVLTDAEKLAMAQTGNLPKGSEPLYGQPVILNMKTGALTNTAHPVVGDFGSVKYTDKGLQYGDKFSAQSITSEITNETSTIDANARYVWFAKRGIRAGDTIDVTDLPALEQLYRQANEIGSGGLTKVLPELEKKGVTLSSGAPLTSFTGDSFTHFIQNAKNNFIVDLMRDNSELSTTELARRANVTENYINSGMKSTNKSDFMIAPKDHEVPNFAKLEYDVGTLNQPDGMIARGAIDTAYRIDLIRQANKDAVAAYLGPEYDEFLASKTAVDADVLGIGNKFLSSSNSGYGTLGQEMERIGRLVTKKSTENISKVSEKLAPTVQALRADEVASAELGMFRAVRLRVGQHFTFLPEELAAKYGVSKDTAILSDSLKRDKTGRVVDWNQDYTPDGFFPGSKRLDRAGEVEATAPYTYYELSPKVAAFERAQQEINDSRVNARNNWWTAQGIDKQLPSGNLYTPPVDTSKYPFFAYVKNKAGLGMGDDGVAVITASDATSLQEKIAALGGDFSIYTKEDLKNFHQVEGDYAYNRNFAQGRVNSALERRGILNDIFPDTRAETLIRDYADWNSKQEISLLRDHIELGNAQLFAELRAMGERFQDTATSSTGFVSAFTKRTASNPYDSYIKTALGISSKDSNYPIWQLANEKVEQFFDKGFSVARDAFLSAKKGVLPYEDAAKMAKEFGLGNPYEAATDVLKSYYGIANKLPDTKFLSGFMAKANSVLGATVIRLDFWQQFIDITTSPILMATEASAVLSGKAGPAKLVEALTTELPDGTGRRIPAVSKLMFNALNNYFDKATREAWLPTYQELGIIRNSKVIDSQFEAINNLAMPFGKMDQSATLQKLDSAVDWAAKHVTQSDRNHDMMRFMSADIGRQIFEAAGYAGKELTDQIGTFQNRVFGNYVASQRPVAFQGPVGQAVGLFQTYWFNLMQQTFRYVEEGQGKSLAILAGMQTSLFGMQSLPGFHFINNHLIGNAAGNPGHSDLYTATGSLMDKKLGDYLLYGSLSQLTGGGLYTRGDINPMSATLLPINPLDFPSVKAGIAFFGNMLETADKIRQGGNTGASILVGLEHNGLSRPLTGLAQLAARLLYYK
jgi:hypothetical protein